MTAAAAPVLAKANMLQPRRLHPTGEHLPVSVISDLIKQHWPALRCLTLGKAKLTVAIQELAAGKWLPRECGLSHSMAEGANLLSVFASVKISQLNLLHLLHPKDGQTAEEMACLCQAFSMLVGHCSSLKFDETSGAASLEATASFWSQLKYLALANQSIFIDASSKLRLARLSQLENSPGPA